MSNKVQTTKVDMKVTQFSNAEALLKKIDPDLFKVYLSMQTIRDLGGIGVVEISMVKGKIKEPDGIWLKPRFVDKTEL